MHRALSIRPKIPERNEPSVPRFRARIRSKRWKQMMADSLPLLLALGLFHDSEVKTSGVLGEDDDITLFSVASSYKRRN